MFYKKGDIVRVRDDLIVGEEYGLCPIKMLHDMKDCCGKTGTVTDVNPVEMAVKVGDWWWSEVMVRFADAAQPKSAPKTKWEAIQQMNAEDAAKLITELFVSYIRVSTECRRLACLTSERELEAAASASLIKYFNCGPEVTP